MGLRAGETCAQLTLFSRLCAARRATNRYGRLFFGFHGFHNRPLLSNKMVNSDQFAAPVALNNCSRELPTSAGVVLWPFGNWPIFRMLPFIKSGRNVATEYSNTEAPLGSCRGALACHERRDITSRPIALKSIPAESDCGNWKLPSTTLWNCYVYHGSVRSHIDGVRIGSIVGTPGKRYRGGL